MKVSNIRVNFSHTPQEKKELISLLEKNYEKHKKTFSMEQLSIINKGFEHKCTCAYTDIRGGLTVVFTSKEKAKVKKPAKPPVKSKSPKKPVEKKKKANKKSTNKSKK
jgi:hypothetical protein